MNIALTLPGHGHVIPSASGARARCGGPAICPECRREQQVVDLAALVMRLAHAVGTPRVHLTLRSQALEYLARQGLLKGPLRGADAIAPDEELSPAELAKLASLPDGAVIATPKQKPWSWVRETRDLEDRLTVTRPDGSQTSILMSDMGTFNGARLMGELLDALANPP